MEAGEYLNNWLVICHGERVGEQLLDICEHIIGHLEIGICENISMDY